MNETDRELLEWAAKAAGIEFGVIHDTPRMKCDAGWTPWNPLNDDGDALRLSVKLRLCHLWQHDWLMIYSGDNSVREYDLTDPFAAIRRAIVRAAAEIGKAMV